MHFRDIPQFPRAHYEIDVPWDYLEDHLKRWQEGYGLELDPDFQRAHVWTRKQQVAYVEYVLMGGEVARNTTWNCVGWNRTPTGPIQLVDGKQRLEAVRRFLRNDLKVFGRFFEQFDGRPDFVRTGFRFRMCSLNTREEILQLYLNINAGGTPHTKTEIGRVRKMLEAEREAQRKSTAAERSKLFNLLRKG